ncbi:DNA-formamidopyrimidine glycosylase [Candidatus Nomurabacteria bacterium RIFCSPHIGHO2_02_FULL_37_45]|uniref:Formamidopyrimidine-DNA glycosylase n=2 Tax=Candidatus Nomuraibacteriota TaxID=1752729 RepID=A0A1F6Y3K3_9BACT|nr:MAG: DNA-formamidopyrimidine glycosylase [Candidatus Nomurabacteria bacterium RIFCSPHIGHO2_01_FULL_37_110]OGI70964.1 MAG: DNA-formamidopyrimidine glycosylase [Candidatus Nomurabacteria bacterium RIFCSPHIGHO2_02_FULL_37_45]OGI79252.1 MAG: DNA-formamidopyrimidine glycosylase [Candidatus Nomurabacteria bacterium RIFCSPHIGHO2_12_FULL_37_29]OGI85374.1 MAG: DNA-formamidopyrimidine glycosylase [Candidatus Nomurabacteria bacterium RIFCSPLOWO2_01_FULL_37_49]OGJ00912.1 MAG: DNA-formamidopyrimidine gly
MPELPEVENLRQGLARTIMGQKIRHVEIRKPKLVSGKGTLRRVSRKEKEKFIRGLTGEKFINVERRAKNLVFKLSHEKIILAHLKMSGQFVYKASAGTKTVMGGHPIELSEKELPNKHTHITFKLERGTLYYNDTRMFGYLLYYPSIKAFETANHFSTYGLEPLSKQFTSKYFSAALKNKNGKIKAVLMDQKIVTGLGNIYADESLFEARIRPYRNASSISGLEVQKLYKAIIRIIRRAIKVGGSSVATYRLLDDTRGNYAREHKVYGKSGKMCANCGKPLEKTVIQSRTTIFCPRCQK